MFNSSVCMWDCAQIHAVFRQCLESHLGSPLTAQHRQEPLSSPCVSELRKADSFQESKHNAVAERFPKHAQGPHQLSERNFTGLSGSDEVAPAQG